MPFLPLQVVDTHSDAFVTTHSFGLQSDFASPAHPWLPSFAAQSFLFAFAIPKHSTIQSSDFDFLPPFFELHPLLFAPLELAPTKWMKSPIDEVDEVFANALPALKEINPAVAAAINLFFMIPRPKKLIA